MQCDILIRGGDVIDPSQQLRGIRDVAIHHGKIAAIEPELTTYEPKTVVDARGLLVTPGLIDLHLHVYKGHTNLGLEPDPLCPAGGVTTMVDTGSAGSINFGAFRRDIIDRADTEILGLVNLSCIGLVAAGVVGELQDRRYADREGVVRAIEEHPGVAIGVKIRAGKHLIGEGQQGWDNLRDAVAAARESGTWLMVHIGDSPMSIPEIVEQLSPGDCITHCFRSSSTTVLDDNGKVFTALKDAAQGGVVFDVGHGRASFQWDVAEAAVDQGLEPTTISTDLHVANIHGPVYDMPTTMSKFLLLGVPLERVIEMSTTRPAAVLNRSDQLGTLRVGTQADVTLLQRLEGEFTLHDSSDNPRTARELLVAAATVRRGELVPGGGGRNKG